MKPGDDFAIDALAGFLPLATRDRLAETLTPAEIDTQTHLLKTRVASHAGKGRGAAQAERRRQERDPRPQPLGNARAERVSGQGVISGSAVE